MLCVMFQLKLLMLQSFYLTKGNLMNNFNSIDTFWVSWALLRGSVIQANGRMAFEDGLRSGGPLHCVLHCTSVRTNFADIMDTLKKFKVPMLSGEVGTGMLVVRYI